MAVAAEPAKRPDVIADAQAVADSSVASGIQAARGALICNAIGSVVEEALEPARGQRRVASRILNIFVTHVALDGPGVVLVVGQFEACRVAEHVGVNLDAEFGLDTGALDHAAKAGRRQWRAAL